MSTDQQHGQSVGADPAVARYAALSQSIHNFMKDHPIERMVDVFFDVGMEAFDQSNGKPAEQAADYAFTVYRLVSFLNEINETVDPESSSG